MPLITDKFGKASIPTDVAVATTVKTTRLPGVFVLEAFDLSKYATDTPVFVITYKKTTDPVTGVVSITNLVSWKALVNPGANTLTNLTVQPGYVDSGNDVGDFIECIPTSAWANSLIDGLLTSMNPDGTLKTSAVQAALNISGAIPPDYTPLGTLPTYLNQVVPTSSFQHRFIVRYLGVDYRDRLQARTKLRIPRTGTTPTQSMNFSGAAGAYAYKTNPSGLNVFNAANVITMECLVRIPRSTITSGVAGAIFGRYGTTSANQQVWMQIQPDGRIELSYANGSGGTTSTISTKRVIPVDRTVHIAAVVSSISARTVTIYVDGKAVTATQPNTSATSISSPSGADLTFGALQGATGNLFTGQIYYARMWNTARTQQQLLDGMFMYLPSGTTGLVGQWKGNGSWNDDTTNANNLTANNTGATNNNPGHAFNAVEIGDIISVDYTGGNTDVTVQMSENAGLPNETFAASAYSGMAIPYGYIPVYPFRSVDNNGFFLTDPGFGGKRVWHKWTYFDPPAIGAGSYAVAGAVDLPDAPGMSSNGDANLFNIQRTITFRGNAPFLKANFENNTIYVWNVSGGTSDAPGMDVFVRVEDVIA